ncbi:hypothetical protein [Roseicella aquatilis]|uniref:Uncharacterized protein n=1 Tax=Roseicella aquatilis TaxID=2527868 RepID=A0A4R4D5T5_9PROT|nr:hypothetical protein [Roseicella aquatilis]TCZ53673.1 hypothetical protein EXY23_24410 [Roseicella aquatilis]
MGPKTISAAVMLFLVTACAGPMAPESLVSPEPTGDPSRRLSTCRYQVSFPVGGTVISPHGRKLIADAVREVHDKGSQGVVLVTPAQSPREGGAVQQQRGDAVSTELRRSGLAADDIETSIVFLDHPKLLDPKVYLDICGRRTEATLNALPMPSMDRIVHYELRGVRLAVPLPYLNPHLWIDTPIGVQRTGELTFHLGWPGLKPVRGGGRRDQRCQFDPVCWHHLSLRLDPPPLSAPELGVLRPTWSDGDMRRLPGTLAGLHFLASPSTLPPVRYAHFAGMLPDGTRVTGDCSWRPRPGQHNYPSAEEIGAILRDANDAHCSLDQFYGTGRLRLSISFSARHLTDWRAIRAEAAGFVAKLASSGSHDGR